jgi:3-hydroxyisobutyrate dehydrogenase-like beta-hydroxyacid dehydrogenase
VTAHTLGWLGTGRMGTAMAARLLKAGHPVIVWNRTMAKAEALAGHGATVAGSIAELAGQDIVFVMVSTPRDLEEVVLGEGGLLSAKRPAVIVDFLNSTVLGSDWVRKRTPDLLALDWTPTFTTELLRKDFDLGLAAARQHEVTMPLAGNVFQLLQAAIGRGYRDADFLSLFAVEAASSGMNVQPQ